MSRCYHQFIAPDPRCQHCNGTLEEFAVVPDVPASATRQSVMDMDLTDRIREIRAAEGRAGSGPIGGSTPAQPYHTYCEEFGHTPPNLTGQCYRCGIVIAPPQQVSPDADYWCGC
jgi:hypothetical protein